MLYHLLLPLREWIGAFNVFRYITVRTAMAFLTALLISFVLGQPLIRKLREMQIGQHIREEGPRSHLSKQGTPTMGGLLILIAVLLPTLLWTDLSNPFVWILILSMLCFGGVGFLDDYFKLTRRRSLGLTALQKVTIQGALALLLGLTLMTLTERGLYTTELSVPFFKMFHPDLGWWYVPFTMLVVIGSANAVNLTDGLDGLAIGSVSIATATYAVLTYTAGHAVVANYLGIANIKGTAELTVFCGALLGAGLGFLWFNCNPARVFMGDVGSMALGAALGTLAVLIKQEILLVLVGGLFVVEAVSVILQVLSFRLCGGRRIFRMAPLHHHFEQIGWKEPQIIIRFWIVAIIFALLGLSTLKLR
ncbi:MAG: phospho-N-acetylmuramoyl-pentapeptide-transferase [Acidobacteriota bacterium]